MQMAACHPPGVTNIANDLPGLHLLAGDADGRTVGIQRLRPAAMVDLDVIAVAASPAVKTIGDGDSSVCSGEDGCALGTGNVGASVGAYLAGDRVNTVAELRGNCTRNRQRPLQRARWRAGAVRRHDLSPALCKAAEQFRPQFFVLRVLQELQVGVLAGGEMIICRHLVECFVGEFYHKDGFGYFCGSWVAVLVGSVYGSRLRVE